MFDLARKRTLRNGIAHGGFGYDAYPDIPMLDSGATITIADVKGPGVVHRLHCCHPKAIEHFPGWEELSPAEQETMRARGIVLEILYDGESEPSVEIPLGDFFGDGQGGRCIHFSTPFVEKVADSYNATIPLPFKERIVVRMRNDTPFDMVTYMTAEYTLLDEWDPALWYLRADWKRWAFQLDPDSDEHFLHIDGPGHLIGQSWSVTSDDPHFEGMFYVMEANNELRIDGEEDPSFEYLGTEDTFNFSWGFQEPFCGIYNGIPHVSRTDPAAISVYRFRKDDTISWESSLDLRVDWTHEMRTENYTEKIIKYAPPEMVFLPAYRTEGRGWIDYATTTYWYGPGPAGPRPEMMPLEQRAAYVLHPNPR